MVSMEEIAPFHDLCHDLCRGSHLCHGLGLGLAPIVAVAARTHCPLQG